MALFDKILKRAATPVETSSGVMYLRELTFAERRRAQSVSDERLSSGLIYALSMVSDDGSLLMPAGVEETDEALAGRMLAEMDSMLPSVLDALNDRINKWLKPATAAAQETLTKN